MSDNAVINNARGSKTSEVTLCKVSHPSFHKGNVE